MSPGAIVAVSIVGLLTAVFIPLRIDVFRQRRAVQIVRARLAGGKVRRRAEGVPVGVVFKIGDRVTHVPRKSLLALADDGLYCLSDDGRWGGRLRFAPGAPGVGDVALAGDPALVVGGRLAGPAAPPPPLAATLAAVPADGLLIPLQGDLSWFVAVPDPADWHAALLQALNRPA